MSERDGVALTSIAHPRASWWRRLWFWLFHHDISAKSIETVEIDLP